MDAWLAAISADDAPGTAAERTIRNRIFGRNAAVVYKVDPDHHMKAIGCDDVQKIRDAYLINTATPKEMNAFQPFGMPRRVALATATRKKGHESSR